MIGIFKYFYNGILLLVNNLLNYLLNLNKVIEKLRSLTIFIKTNVLYLQGLNLPFALPKANAHNF